MVATDDGRWWQPATANGGVRRQWMVDKVNGESSGNK